MPSTTSWPGLAETRLLLDATEPSLADPVAIALAPPATTAAGIVEYTLEVLARAALGMWPVWFTDVDFSPFERTALGHDAARLRVKEATASSMGGVILPWAEVAVALALEGRRLIRGIHAATEIRQLGRRGRGQRTADAFSTSPDGPLAQNSRGTRP